MRDFRVKLFRNGVWDGEPDRQITAENAEDAAQTLTGIGPLAHFGRPEQLRAQVSPAGDPAIGLMFYEVDFSTFREAGTFQIGEAVQFTSGEHTGQTGRIAKIGSASGLPVYLADVIMDSGGMVISANVTQLALAPLLGADDLTFKLSVVPEESQHRDWAASNYKGDCYVGAGSEDEARSLASTEFAMATRRDGGPTRANPWRQPSLVKCEQWHGQRVRRGTVVPSPLVGTVSSPKPPPFVLGESALGTAALAGDEFSELTEVAEEVLPTLPTEPQGPRTELYGGPIGSTAFGETPFGGDRRPVQSTPIVVTAARTLDDVVQDARGDVHSSPDWTKLLGHLERIAGAIERIDAKLGESLPALGHNSQATREELSGLLATIGKAAATAESEAKASRPTSPAMGLAGRVLGALGLGIVSGFGRSLGTTIMDQLMAITGGDEEVRQLVDSLVFHATEAAGMITQWFRAAGLNF